MATLGVDELLDFDVGALCREPEWEVKDNEWDDGREAKIFIFGAHAGRGGVIVAGVNDNPTSNDDSQDKDFVGDDELLDFDVDDSENVSLDEENNSSESENDDQLEVEVEQRM